MKNQYRSKIERLNREEEMYMLESMVHELSKINEFIQEFGYEDERWIISSAFEVMRYRAERAREAWLREDWNA